MLAGLFISLLSFSQEAQFAPPIRLMAGDAFLGERRAYASPAFHDVNGDGHLDVVIGDLMGRVTVALGSGISSQRFAAEKAMLGKDRQPLEFNNW